MFDRQMLLVVSVVAQAAEYLHTAWLARMILTSTEFMANAPEGDFDRSFSDGVLEDIAAQLRKGGNQ